MNLIVTILLAILIFGVIIMIHELGHFLTAKAVGIRAPEFSHRYGATAVPLYKRGDQVYAATVSDWGICCDGRRRRGKVLG